MTPLIAVALVAGAAGAAYLFSRRQIPGAAPGADKLTTGVDKLTKGRTYAIMVTLTAQDGRNGQKPIGTKDPTVASANLKNIYEILGFKVLSAPVLRNAAEVSDFLHGNPSVWLFNGQWTLDKDTIDVEPAFVLSHSFVPLTIQ